MKDKPTSNAIPTGLDNKMMLHNMQKLFLEALRHREQDIIRFLVILGPGLAGYLWLLKWFYSWEITISTFIIGKIGIILILLGGAWYSLALGYNFRSLIIQIAKIEYALKLAPYTLKYWPRKLKDFYKPQFSPPEIIKVFYWAFIVAIVLVGINTDWISWLQGKEYCTYFKRHVGYLGNWIFAGSGLMAIGCILLSKHYARKIKDICIAEDKKLERWNFDPE